MIEILKQLQLDFMLILSGCCAVLIVLSYSTKTLSASRRRALLYMETSATFLLLFDRFAYIFRGKTSELAFYMVRISNFMVYLLSLFVLHSFNLYVMDLFRSDKRIEIIPKRLIFCEVLFSLGALTLILSQFTGFYYTFDSTNHYQRSDGFILCYAIPFLMLAIQFSVIFQYRKILGWDVVKSLFLFTTIPFVATIIQVFTYGFSLTNISMVGLVVVIYVFEIKNMNHLEEEKIAAERANTAKSRFLTNISHEIRTPINTIMGMNEMILREDATGVPDRYFKTISSNAKNIQSATDTLLGLVNDILDISEIESGQMTVANQAYSLEEMLRGLIPQYRARCAQKNIDFRYVIDSKIPSVLFGDKVKIRQIIMNLLSNAIRFTEEGEVILSIKMEEENEDNVKIVYSVSDTGVGFREEDKEILFSNFSKLEDMKSSDIQGVGFGMDISKSFVNLMGGTIDCSSELGKGSVFSFTLVQKIVNPKPIGEFKEEASYLSKKAYIPHFIAPDVSVLVVDDNPMNLSVIRGLLSATKMYITTVTSGEECLEKLDENAYDIVLLDHMMPGMDGLETVLNIRKKYPKLPVLALTANYISNGEEFYIRNGFDGYLPKPVDGESLEIAIRKFIPDNVVMDVCDEDMKDVTEIPEEYSWVKDAEGIDVDDGIRFSGGSENFISSLKMFLDTIDENIDVIKKAYREKDYKFYTVKVHALKSSARIVGAKKLSEIAKNLEDAGKHGDENFIKENTKNLLDLYSSYKEKLSRFLVEDENDSLKEKIDREEIFDAIDALKELVPQMDYDSCEMVIDQILEYKLEDVDLELFRDLKKSLKVFDWDSMEERLSKVK